MIFRKRDRMIAIAAPWPLAGGRLGRSLRGPEEPLHPRFRRGQQRLKHLRQDATESRSDLDFGISLNDFRVQNPDPAFQKAASTEHSSGRIPPQPTPFDPL